MWIKAKEEEEKVDLEEEAMTALIGQPFIQMKQTDQPVPLTVTIYPSLTK